MGRKCAAENCRGILHTFSFPQDEALKQRWVAFVKERLPNFELKPSSCLCFRHFQNDQLKNMDEYKSGFAFRLSLTPGAIPTIQIPAHGFNVSTPRHMKISPKTTPRSRKRLVDSLLAASQSTEASQPKTPRESRPSSSSPHESTPPITTTPTLALCELPESATTPTKAPKTCSSATQTEAEITGLPLFEHPLVQRPASDSDSLCDPDKPSLTGAAKGDSSPGSSLHPPSTPSGIASSCSSPSLYDYTSTSTDASEYVADGEESDEDWEADSEEETEYLEYQAENEKKFKQRPASWHNDLKIIVYEDALLELLQVCPKCANQSTVDVIKVLGSFIEYETNCTSCKHTRRWTNSKAHLGVPVVNLLLACGILFSGSLPTKFLRALGMINMRIMTPRTYHNYQRSYLHGAIRTVYDRHMNSVLVSVSQPLNVAGDGRYDSPGHSATFGLYTMMDTKSSKVIVSKLVKSTETTSSSAMELEGLKRCRQYLTEKNIPVGSITTDRHISINAYIRDKWPGVFHYFDAWHISKGITKKLTKLAQSKVAYKPIGRWCPALTNHLYYTIDNSDCQSNLRRDMWLSAANHICNIHTHDSDILPQCLHGDLEAEKVDSEGVVWVRDWLNPDGPQILAVKKILEEKALVEAIGRASMHSTSELESFHSALNRNAPKMEGFGYSAMLSRVQLTILHHNENCQRPVKLTLDGQKRRGVVRNKATAQRPRIQFIREDPTYGYIKDLFKQLDSQLREPCNSLFADDPTPPTLASKGPSYESLDKLEAELDLRRRGKGVGLKPHLIHPQLVGTARPRGRRHHPQ